MWRKQVLDLSHVIYNFFADWWMMFADELQHKTMRKTNSYHHHEYVIFLLGNACIFQHFALCYMHRNQMQIRITKSTWNFEAFYSLVWRENFHFKRQIFWQKPYVQHICRNITEDDTSLELKYKLEAIDIKKLVRNVSILKKFWTNI